MRYHHFNLQILDSSIDQLRWNAFRIHRINLLSSHKSIFRFLLTLLFIENNLSVNFQKWISYREAWRPNYFHFYIQWDQFHSSIDQMRWNAFRIHRMTLLSSHKNRFRFLLTLLSIEINFSVHFHFLISYREAWRTNYFHFYLLIDRHSHKSSTVSHVTLLFNEINKYLIK